MGRALEDFPEQSRKCPDCGKTTWETEYYACDCREEEKEHTCPECGDAFDPDLFKTLRGCYDHTDNIEKLREIAADLDQYIDGQRKVVKEQQARIRELELGVDALDKGLKSLQELSGCEPIAEAVNGR